VDRAATAPLSDMGYGWRMRSRAALAVVALGLGCAAGEEAGQAVPSAMTSAAATAPSEVAGADVIGTEPPPWQVRSWIHSEPLELAQLRGKVVLVRWFMSPTCPWCTASAPALRALDQRYRGRGLVVIGMYHHKDDEPLVDADVADHARSFGYEFPIAIDPDWQTLKNWWLDARERDFTSVSFLIDKRGVIRHVHPGGTIALDKADGQALERRIEELLAERPPG
jgi:peroxiredoxin